MTQGLKPYFGRKETGVEWLEEVPAHWEVRRLKSVCSQYALYGANMTANSYSPTGVRFIRTTDITEDGRLKAGGVFLPEELIREYLLTDGDILISRSGTIGRSFLYDAKKHGKCAYAGYLVRFVSDRDILPEYLVFFTKTHEFGDFLRLHAISSTIDNVNGEKYANSPIPLPPLPEQTAITRFLNHTDNRIQRYIRAKQKLLILLEEQKQAIIHEAVTGQIDIRTGESYPAYKPSGVEWLGDVPKHWEVRKLGQTGRFSKGVGGNKEDEMPEGVPCVRYGDLYTSHTNFIHRSRSCVSRLKATEYAPIKFGDILFAASGETIDEIGKSAVNLLTSDAVCGGDVILLRLRCPFDARYMGYVTNCRPVTTQKSIMGRGITVMHIYASHLKYVAIPLPPLSEQTAIAKYLDKVTNDIDTAITRTGRQIELLEEYRTRLTGDVVTGKLDVREAVAEFPDKVNALEPPTCSRRPDRGDRV